MDENNFSIKKNFCFALNYLFIPIGIILLILQGKTMTKEDKTSIIRAFVITALLSAASTVISFLSSLAVVSSSIVVVAIFFWLINAAFIAAYIVVLLDKVFAIIGLFINKSLKVPVASDLITKISAKFAR